MSRSLLQEPFLHELAESFLATKKRIVRRLRESGEPAAASIVEDELRGLYHAISVIFDGGTALASHGLIGIVGEDGNTFDRFLHEICFQYWPDVAGSRPHPPADAGGSPRRGEPPASAGG